MDLWNTTLIRLQRSEDKCKMHKKILMLLLQGTEIPGFTPDYFIQFVEDNVDRNIRTLDGHTTFHGRDRYHYRCNIRNKKPELSSKDI